MLIQALSMVFDGEMKTISGCRQKCKQIVLSLGASLERSHSWTSFIWSKWLLPVISYDRNIQWSRWSILQLSIVLLLPVLITMSS